MSNSYAEPAERLNGIPLEIPMETTDQYWVQLCLSGLTRVEVNFSLVKGFLFLLWIVTPAES